MPATPGRFHSIVRRERPEKKYWKVLWSPSYFAANCGGFRNPEKDRAARAPEPTSKVTQLIEYVRYCSQETETMMTVEGVPCCGAVVGIELLTKFAASTRRSGT